uniref:alanine racemase n=1 Tax=Burkholderia pseudomallei TaxID=28450 RepID=UPI003F679601
MIARLRTAAGNVPLFEQAGAAPGVPTGSLTHAVRPDLLAAAERAAAAGAGALPEPSAAHLRAVLVALARDATPWCSPARRSGRASM